MRKLILAIALPLAALAADPAGFHLWKSGDLKASEKKLSPKIDAQKISGESLANAGNHMFSISHREGPGIAELHEKVADVFVVISGDATLVVGGTIPGSKQSAPNEVRGPKIEGGASHKLAVGDIVTIPAGAPHQLLVDPGKQFTYFVVKVVK
jgi:mannose-6-phosphate isomerase-like protein (cupin superfamily)